MNPRVLALLPLLGGCHSGYLSPTVLPADSDPEDLPEVVAAWAGTCSITEVTRAASEDGEDGIDIAIALEVTGQKVVCSSDLGDSKACWAVAVPAANADWPGGGEGQLDPEGLGPFDMLLRIEAEGYCFPKDEACDPSWDLYLWGDVVDGVFQGDCQSISTGAGDNYPVTWGSGSFALHQG